MKILGKIFAIIFLALIAYLFWILLKSLYAGLESIDVETAITVLSIFATVGIAVYTQFTIRTRQVEESLREHKRQIYTNFCELMLDLVAASKPETAKLKLGQKEQQKLLFEFKRNMMVYSSKEVLEAFLKCTDNSNSDQNKLFENFSDLIVAMRKDLGIKEEIDDPDFFLKVYLQDSAATRTAFRSSFEKNSKEDR